MMKITTMRFRGWFGKALLFGCCLLAMPVWAQEVLQQTSFGFGVQRVLLNCDKTEDGLTVHTVQARLSLEAEQSSVKPLVPPKGSRCLPFLASQPVSASDNWLPNHVPNPDIDIHVGPNTKIEECLTWTLDGLTIAETMVGFGPDESGKMRTHFVDGSYTPEEGELCLDTLADLERKATAKIRGLSRSC